MKEFFLILLFGKVVLLTPEPVSFHGRLEVVLEKPISAITSGAKILLDVSSMVDRSDEEGLMSIRKKVKQLFPEGCVTAKLLGKGHTTVPLQYSGHTSINEDNVRIALSAVSGVPTDMEFNRVVVDSKKELKTIKILWKNFEH